MKLIIVLTLFGLSLAELKTYDEFRTYSSGNHKTVSDYALELGFDSFDHEFKRFKVFDEFCFNLYLNFDSILSIVRPKQKVWVRRGGGEKKIEFSQKHAIC